MATGGWSGLWNDVYGASHDFLVCDAFYHNPTSKRIQKLFRRNRYGVRKLTEALEAAIGAAAGSMTDSIKRVSASKEPEDDGFGGVRTIETRTLSSAATISDTQETAIKALITGTSKPTYPTEKSGNSGGGKLGF